MSKAVVDETVWTIGVEIPGAGTKTLTLNQANKFVDKDTVISINTAAGALGAGTGEVSGSSDITGLLGTAQSSQPATGHYIKVEGDANVAVATSGWLNAGTDVDVSIADKYYAIAEGAQTITGGALSEGTKSVAINSDGAYNGSSYDTSDKVKFEAGEAAGMYKIHPSGSAVVNRAVVTKQVTQDGYFAADGTAQSAIAADSITVDTPETAYYIKKSTLSTTSVTPSTSAQTITVYEGYAPADRTITVAPMAPGAADSSLDEVGTSTYFNAGTSSDYDVVLTPQFSITTSGYLAETANPVDGTPIYYKIKAQTVTETATTVSGDTATRGTRTESIGWKDTAETLTSATFANTASSGVPYVDISSTTAAPVLVSGDYLYINKGWTDNLKISLAKLVPDGSNITGHADKILQGYTAYDSDGSLVTGSIQTWDGDYTLA